MPWVEAHQVWSGDTSSTAAPGRTGSSFRALGLLRALQVGKMKSFTSKALSRSKLQGYWRCTPCNWSPFCSLELCIGSDLCLMKVRKEKLSLVFKNVTLGWLYEWVRSRQLCGCRGMKHGGKGPHASSLLRCKCHTATVFGAFLLRPQF